MFIIDYLLKSSLLVLLFLCLGFLLRNFSASVRYSLWRLAFVLLALLPLGGMLMPVASIPIIPAAQEIQLATAAPRLNRPPIEEGAGEARIAAAPAHDSEIEAREAGAGAGSGFSLLRMMIILDWIWPAGSCFILVLIIAGNIQIFRLRRARLSITEPGLKRALGDQLALLSLNRKVRVFASEKIGVPVTWGWLRPVILVPADFQGWSSRQLNLNLLHELEHVKRHDYTWNLFVNFSCAIVWLNPLVWLAAVFYRAEREKSIDENIVRRGVKPSEYAHHLVEAASSLLHGSRLLRSQFAVSKISSLKARVLSILSSSTRRKSIPGWSGFIAGVLLCCAALPLASISFRSAGGSADLAIDGGATSMKSTGTFEGLPQSLVDYKNAFGHFEREEYEQAGPLLEALIRDFPYLGDAKMNLAWIYIHKGRHVQARKLIYDVMLLHPEWDFYCARLLAYSYAGLADTDRTLHWLARAIKLRASDLEKIRNDEQFARVLDDVRFQLLMSLISDEAWRELELTFIKPEFDAEVRRTLLVPPSKPLDIEHLAYTAENDPDHSNRIIAVTLLGGLGTLGAVDAIVEVLENEFDPDVIEYGLYALAGVPRDDTADRLLRLCDGGNPWILAFGGWMVGKFAPDKAAEILIRATFTDIDHECHEDAVNFLSRLPDNRGAEALRYLAGKHPSDSIRKLAKERLEFITKAESS